MLILFIFTNNNIAITVFSILYCLHIASTFGFICCGKDKENEGLFVRNYRINLGIENNHVNIYNNSNNNENNNIGFYQRRRHNQVSPSSQGINTNARIYSNF